MLCRNLKVESPNVQYTSDCIESKYDYQSTQLEVQGDTLVATPVTTQYEFRTQRQVPKLGVMLVGWGGNNGSTVTAGVLANKNNISWNTKAGPQQPNYFGSLTQSSTVRIGNADGKEVYVPFSSVLPMVHPNDIVLGGWDISKRNLADAMQRSGVLDFDLQRKLQPLMEDMVPLPGIFDQNFVAANQAERADNLIKGSKSEQLAQIRKDLRDFKSSRGVDSTVVLWTANTERYAELQEGVHDTAENILQAIEKDEDEIAPSTIFAVACILESVPFINGSPQNTFVPGVVELSEKHNVLIGGDDFKSGQTKM